MGVGIGQRIVGTAEVQLWDLFLQDSPKAPRDPRGGNERLPLRPPILSTLICSGQLGAEGQGKAARLQVEGSPPHVAVVGSHYTSHFLSDQIQGQESAFGKRCWKQPKPVQGESYQGRERRQELFALRRLLSL